MNTTMEIPDPRIGLAGDWHGNFNHARETLLGFHERGIRVAIQMGDWGFLWGGTDSGAGLRKLEQILKRLDMELLFLDGNHENFRLLERRRLDPATGLRPIAEHITHLPRGARLSLGGRSTVVLGGAGSIDVVYRTPFVSWWPQEAISDEDVTATAALGPVEIMFAHEAPYGISRLDQRLEWDMTNWAPDSVRHATTVRGQLQRAFESVRPELFVGGHHHNFYDERVVTKTADGEFVTRVVVLDRDDESGHLLSQAILTPATLEIQPISRRL
jgi:hypothetical protein